jgi:Holliday junction resolvasome RuvABC DNA-binding subunit
MKPVEVVSAVDQSDVNAFKSVKGIGLKSAQRIIVDLKGKLDKIEWEKTFSPQMAIPIKMKRYLH